MNKETTYLYTLNSKMSDMILNDIALLDVLLRFGIPLGFGEKCVEEVCRLHSVDPKFFLIVANINSFQSYLPSLKELGLVNVKELVDYLKNSHKNYINRRIITIEDKLVYLSESVNRSDFRLILKFFRSYKAEVIKHFSYEEQMVFPYINSLLEERPHTDSYSIEQYEDNHSNIDDKLSDLKNLIIKYLPYGDMSQDALSAVNDVLKDIFAFEEDLSKHTRIENKVLIPMVHRIEEER